MGGDANLNSTGPSPERAGTSSEVGSQIGGGGSGSGSQAKTMTSARSITSGNKHKKIVRVLTVVAYVCSVSTAAVLLSAYYIFLWNPQTSQEPEASASRMAMARTASLTSPQASSPSFFSSSLTTTNRFQPPPSASSSKLEKVASSSLRAFHGSSSAGANFKRAAVLTEELDQISSVQNQQEVLPSPYARLVFNVTESPSPQVQKSAELKEEQMAATSPTEANSVLALSGNFVDLNLARGGRMKRWSSSEALHEK